MMSALPFPQSQSQRSPGAIDRHIGLILQDLRRKRGLTQSDIAAALGISFQQVQKYERGANRISASGLYYLARILGVEPKVFFTGLDPVRPRDADEDSVEQT